MLKPTIAIDGYSSTGKSSLAKALAKKLGITHIDTGAMYRAVTWWALNNCSESNSLENFDVNCLISNLKSIELDFRWNEQTQTNEILLDGKSIEKEIRSMEVAKFVSEIAKIKEVREFLVEKQRAIAKTKPVVMDGRDIGTIVLPDADFKFFITAKPEIRAERRFLELKTSQPEITFDAVYNNLLQRDHEDANRAIAPLKPASDGIIIDNSELNFEQTLNTILDILNKRGYDVRTKENL